MIFWKSIAFSASLLYLLALAKKPCFGCQPMERQGLRRAEPLHKLWTWSKSLYNYVRVEYVYVTVNVCIGQTHTVLHYVHIPSTRLPSTHSCALCTPGMACEALASVPCESMHLARKVPVPVPSRIEATKNEKHNAHLQCDILIDFETFWYILVHVVQMN